MCLRLEGFPMPELLKSCAVKSDWRMKFLGLAMLATLASVPSAAATLMVGPGQTYKAPSDAASAASAGDIIRIMPGTYFDCAIWTVGNLTIEGTAPGVVLT